MTPDVETTLREALDARYALVMPDPAAYDAVLRRRSRRRLTRWAVPVAAAVAAAGAVVVVARPADRAPTPVATPPPSPHRLMLGRLSPRGVPQSGVSSEAVVATAGSLSPVTATPPDLDVKAVAAVGDGRTFYVIGGETCHNVLYRVTAAETTSLGTLDTGWPEGMAVTHDGARLAYAFRPAAARTCSLTTPSNDRSVEGPTELRVRDLVTGDERAWRTPRAAFAFDAMAWAPDGRTLAYGARNVVLTMDTTAPGEDVPTVERWMAFGGREPADACEAHAPAYLPDGTLVSTYVCAGGGDREAGVARYDVATATIGEPLFDLPDDIRPSCLALDRTGRHAYVCADPSGLSGDDSRRTLWEWHGGAEATRVELDRPAPSTVTW